MEKISGIIPSNARVKSVDLNDSKPVRPGVPTFGQNEGRNTVKDRVSLNTSKEEAFKQTLGYKNPKEARQAKMVEELSRKFFESRVPATKQVVDETPSTAEQVESSVAMEPSELTKLQLEPTRTSNISPLGDADDGGADSVAS